MKSDKEIEEFITAAEQDMKRREYVESSNSVIDQQMRETTFKHLTSLSGGERAEAYRFADECLHVCKLARDMALIPTLEDQVNRLAYASLVMEHQHRSEDAYQLREIAHDAHHRIEGEQLLIRMLTHLVNSQLNGDITAPSPQAPAATKPARKPRKTRSGNSQNSEKT